MGSGMEAGMSMRTRMFAMVQATHLANVNAIGNIVNMM